MDVKHQVCWSSKNCRCMPHRFEYWKNGRNKWSKQSEEWSLKVETVQDGILDLATRRQDKWMNRMVGVNADRITKKSEGELERRDLEDHTEKMDWQF